MTPKHCRIFPLSVVLCLVLAAPVKLSAQQAAEKGPTLTGSSIVNTNYTRTGWFPNFTQAYVNPRVPSIQLENSPRLTEMIQNGKVDLSLNDAISLAIENNLDISLQRYNIAYAKMDIIRAASGGATRGVTGAFSSSALFSGALGGGISVSSAGGGGGAAGGATGAGAGAFNIGPIGSFDPVVGFTAGYADQVTPLGTTTVTGVPSLTQHSSSYSGFFGQEFVTGTSYALSLGGFRQSTNALTNIFNPQVVGGLTFAINQHLLNGFGYRANAKFIRIAATDLKISTSYFRQQVIATMTTMLGDYWNLVTDKENVRVAQEAVTYAQKLLEDNKRQVEIGTLAPIDVVQAESQLATAQTNLVVAQTNYLQAQSVIKTALSKRVTADLAAAEINPTDSLPEPHPGDVPELDEAVKVARANRPEIEQGLLNLQNENVVLKANRNGLLPTLDFFAAYRPSALSGNRLIFGAPAAGSFLAPVIGETPGGIGGAFTQLFQNQYPNYSVGFTLQMPIRNRAAQADSARALLEQRSLRTQLQQTENNVEQDVRNALIAVTQAKAQIEAAQKAVEYARQTLDAEQKKFKVGESTVFQVIQQQNNLTTAEGTLVTAHSTYAKALTQYEQATGTTLSKNNVEISDAVNGAVSRPPNIPGTPGR